MENESLEQQIRPEIIATLSLTEGMLAVDYGDDLFSSEK